MKIKFYLWSLLTFVLMSFAATGCSDDDDVVAPGPDHPDQPTVNMTFNLSVNNIAAHGADLKVVPSDNNHTYFADVAPADKFAGQSDDAIIGLITSMIKDAKLMKGETLLPASTMNLNPETEYVFFALGYEDGKVISKLAKTSFTTLKEEGSNPEPDKPEVDENAPVVEFDVFAGLSDGTMKESVVSLLAKCTSQDANYAAILVDTDSQVDEAMKQEGVTLEAIIDANASGLQLFERAWLDAMNLKDPEQPDGIYLNLSGAEANHKYTMLLDVKNDKGGRTVKRGDCTTADRKTKVQMIDEKFFIEHIWDFKTNSDWVYAGNSPVVIDFFATWCGPCKMMIPILDKCSFDYDGQVSIYQLDIDKDPAVWNSVCRLSGHDGAIPFFWMINSQGKITKQRGACQEAQFRKLIESILDGAPAPADPPVLSLTAVFDASKNGINYQMQCLTKDAAYAAYAIANQPDLDKILKENNATLEDIMNIPDNVNQFPAEYLEPLNGAGVEMCFDKGTIGVNYAMILDVQNEGMGRAIKRVDCLYEEVKYEEGATLTNTRPNGLTIHMEVPAAVKERGNAIRYNRACLPMYNMMKMQGMPDCELLMTNGGLYMTESGEIYIDEEHSSVIDPETGEEYVIGDPLCPGEPTVFMAGEFTWGESEYGWGEGYYNWLFDYDAYMESIYGGDGGGMLMSAKPGVVRAINRDEAKFWNGYYHCELYSTAQPQKFDGDVKYTMLDLTPIEATMRFEPDPSVKRYCVMFMDQPTYDTMLMPMLDNNPDYMQWFTSSYFAFMQMGVQAFEEPVDLNLSEWVGELEPGMMFQVCVVAMGDVDGMTQNYHQYEIVMPERTEPAPVIKTTAINNPLTGEADPFEVWFNVKTIEGNVESAKFAANYKRDFDYMLSHGYDYYSLVDQMGNAFSKSDLDKINSAEGLNVRFDCRPYTTMVMSVVGYNSERLGSEASYDEVATADIPAGERVESDYFTSLKGEWTASAVLSHFDYNESVWVPDAKPTKFKVSISNGVSNYPEVLPEEVYALYDTFTREQVDAMYAEFKDRAAIYDQRLRQGNCIQMEGFGFDPKGRLDFKSPYDLFTSTSYSATDNDALFEDFGPKWYLKVNADGTLCVPINTNYMNPMCAWGMKYGRKDTYFLVGMGETDFIGMTESARDPWFEFPVVVSNNGNTLTINPIVHNNNSGVETTYYPSVMNYMQDFRPIDSGKIISAITLTKGWTEPAPASVSYKFGTESINSLGNIEMTEKNYKSLAKTFFSKSAIKNYKQVKSTQLVGQKFVEKMNQLAQSAREQMSAIRMKEVKREAEVRLENPTNMASAQIGEVAIEKVQPVQQAREVQTISLEGQSLKCNIRVLPGLFL